MKMLTFERKRSVVSIHILDNRTLRSFEKPSKLKSNDNTRNPYKYVEHVDNRLNYYHIQRVVKCELYVLTLKGASHPLLENSHSIGIGESPLRRPQNKFNLGGMERVSTIGRIWFTEMSNKTFGRNLRHYKIFKEIAKTNGKLTK